MLDLLGFVSVTSATSAFFLNLALLPIIAMRSGKNIGSYKALLFLNTLVATLYSANHAITIPAFYVENGKYILFSANTWLPASAGAVSTFTFALTFLFIVISLSLSFIYRLSVMTGYPSQTWFQSPRKIAIIVIVAVLICVGAMTIIVVALWPNENVAREFGDAFYKQSEYNLSQIGFQGGYLYDPVSGDIKNGVLASMTAFGGVSVVAISIMTFCTIGILRAFRTSLKLIQGNTTTMKYHKKLFILLLLQSFFPFVFTLSPVLLCFSLALLHLSPGSIPNHLGSVMAISTVVEPLLVVFLVRDYNRAIKGYFRQLIHPSTVVAASSYQSRTVAHLNQTTHTHHRERQVHPQGVSEVFH